MRDKPRPNRKKRIRGAALLMGPAPKPTGRRAALNHLHELPAAKLHDFAASAAREIARLRAHVKHSQVAIADLLQVQQLIVRLEAQRTPPRDGATRAHAEVAAGVLRDVGHAMQLKDLLGAMADRGAVVAGKSERQRRSNLIIALGRSPLVRRVGHGLYALTETRASA